MRVKIAYLFGGRAKGYTVRGDYDIAVLMEGGCDLYKLGGVECWNLFRQIFTYCYNNLRW